MADAAPAGSSLAARCTACSTVFRVVPDQLRVSAGWVRCGRCSEVFNAAENLIDLDTGAPRRLDLGTARSGAAAALPPPTAPEDLFADDAMATTEVLAGPAPERPTPDMQAGPRPEPEPELAPAPAPMFPDVRVTGPGLGPVPAPVPAPPFAPAPDPEPAALHPDDAAAGSGAAKLPDAVDAAAPAPEPGAEPEPQPAPAQAAPSASAWAPDTAASSDPASPLPSFVRRADRAARWRQPRVRAALAGGVVVAALLLAVQVAVSYRDLAAARWPGLRPVLETSCRLLGCRVGPAQAIEALTVEGSGLVRVEQTQLYELTVGVRNRGLLDLAVPAVELSLTDAQGRLLSRRVLLPAELGVAPTSVAAGRDLVLQATLQTVPLSTPLGGDASEGVIAGYTIELFYP